MCAYFNHPVIIPTLFLSFVILSSLAGCKDDDEPIVEVKPDARVEGPRFDLGPAPTLPMPVADIFRYMPEAPKGIRARPGDAATPLIKAKQVKLVKGFRRIYSELLNDGPFRRVQYVLSADEKTVTRVIATFHRQYARKDRRESIVEMISVRLGEPKEFKTNRVKGHRWTLPDFGIEVREDTESAKFFSSQPLELVFDARTRYQP